MPSPRDLLRTIRDELRQQFLERAELIDGALVALLAGQHVLVIGPPGTAKSMLADEVCRRINGARYFQWLLTRFTTPEELFGAVSLNALERDEYRRLTTHKLPEAHIAFLDEVFKASSSILNTILTLMNERRFHNGREVSAGAAAHALRRRPTSCRRTTSCWRSDDRFLLRFVVDYIGEDFRFLKLLQAQAAAGAHDALARRARGGARRGRGGDGAGRRAARRHRPPARARPPQASSRRIAARRSRSACCARTPGSTAATRSATTTSPSSSTSCGAIRRSARPCATSIRELLHGYEDEVRVLLYQSRELRDYALREWETPDLRSRAGGRGAHQAAPHPRQGGRAS